MLKNFFLLCIRVDKNYIYWNYWLGIIIIIIALEWIVKKYFYQSCHRALPFLYLLISIMVDILVLVIGIIIESSKWKCTNRLLDISYYKKRKYTERKYSINFKKLLIIIQTKNPWLELWLLDEAPPVASTAIADSWIIVESQVRQRCGVQYITSTTVERIYLGQIVVVQFQYLEHKIRTCYEYSHRQRKNIEFF